MFKGEIKSEKNEDICILIKVDNHPYNYICDCGEAKNLGVKECQNTNALFISHTHIDHFVNFDTILRHQIGIQRKVVITGPTGIIDQVQNRIKSYCWNLIEKGAISYEVREIQKHGLYKSVTLNPPFWKKENEEIIESDIIFEEKEFGVEYEILDHKTESIAYLFKAKNKTKIELPKELKGGKWVADLKQAFRLNDEKKLLTIDGQEYKAKELFHLVRIEKGKKMGIIMDHAASKENHELILNRFSGCEDIFIESFYKDEDIDLASKNYHSYASISAEIMRRCEAKNVIPVHFSRKYNENEIQELIDQFEAGLK